MCRKCLRWMLLLLVLPLQAHAGLLQDATQAVKLQVGPRGATGITVRGGVGLRTGQSGVTTLFRGQAQFSGSCNAFDFADSIKEAFESVPEVLHTLSQALLQNLPVLIVCSSDP